MPTDSNVWIVLIIVAGLVTALAIWFGRGLKVKKNKSGMEMELRGDQKPAPTGIQVANNAQIKGSTVGDIAGIKLEGATPPGAPTQPVRVFNESKLNNVEAGDIAGIKQTSPKPDQPR